LESISELDEFNHSPWTSGYFQGLVDVPFLTLTPGTRSGIIRDENFNEMVSALKTLENQLAQGLSAQKEAEEQRASRATLTSLHKAFHEALLALPPEEFTRLTDLIARKLAELEREVKGQGVQIQTLVEAIRQLMPSPGTMLP